MPTEHIRFSYTFDELSDAAKAHAVEVVAEKLGGDWWDSDDNESIGEVILYTLAEQFKAAGWDHYGAGDFPGIDGISIDGWSVDGAGSIALTGSLTRDNAPGLDWPTVVDHVDLTSGPGGRGDYTSIDVVAVDLLEFDCTSCGQRSNVSTNDPENTNHVIPTGDIDEDQDHDHKAFSLEGLPTAVTSGQFSILDRFEQTVRDCLSEAVIAGTKEMEYKTSTEYAQEYVANNDQQFTEDGDLF